MDISPHSFYSGISHETLIKRNWKIYIITDIMLAEESCDNGAFLIFCQGETMTPFNKRSSVESKAKMSYSPGSS